MTNFTQCFGEKATWIKADESIDFPLFRKRFEASGVVSATLTIFGTGSYVFYVNGTRGCDEYFTPLNSEYEARENYPQGQKLTGFHAYVGKYDVTPLIRDGKNALCVMLGNGWYTGLNRPFSAKNLPTD